MSEVHKELERYMLPYKVSFSRRVLTVCSIDDIHKAFETKDRNVFFFAHEGFIPPPAVECVFLALQFSGAVDNESTGPRQGF